MKKKYLSREDYFQALSLTQLVSIDLLIFHQNKILVGERNNNPAQGCLFVPGGKVYKNEYLVEGLKRVSMQEIGFPLNTDQVRLKGIYDHTIENAMLAQHHRIEWLKVNTILHHPKVHDNVKSYFQNKPTNIFL